MLFGDFGENIFDKYYIQLGYPNYITTSQQYFVVKKKLLCKISYGPALRSAGTEEGTPFIICLKFF